MAEAVLDASAIMAFVRDEPGASVVAEYLPGAFVSTVNLSEVLKKAVDAAPDSVDRAWQYLMALGMEAVDFDIRLARRTGELRAATRKLGLSFADRACLALAEREGLPALTADSRWSELDTGVAVTLIR
jgi:PIN domain nuclease of toxin-antitoxin system